MSGAEPDRTPPAGKGPSRKEWWWAVARLALGQAQIIGAVAAAYLICFTGVNAVSLTAVAFTCAFTTLSVLLFRLR